MGDKPWRRVSPCQPEQRRRVPCVPWHQSCHKRGKKSIWNSMSDDHWSGSSAGKWAWEGLYVWWKCVHCWLLLSRPSLSSWSSRYLSDWSESLHHRRWSRPSIFMKNRSNWPLDTNFQAWIHHLQRRDRYTWRRPRLLIDCDRWRNCEKRRIHIWTCGK